MEAVNITTKFTIGSEQGLAALSYLTRTIAVEKFSGLVPPDVLNGYIQAQFNDKRLINETNSMSNQWLVVYAGDAPAGYARITSEGARPEELRGKRSIRIADFALLKEYDKAEIMQSLFDKCMVACKAYENIWMKEYKENPCLSFFESAGFVKQAALFQHTDLPLDVICLIR